MIRERALVADGVNIFLDEIGELSDPQSKLLRVLQEGSSVLRAAPKL
jgi:transcriptional regulator with GAF, ATPase, and Fis domain